MKPRIFSTLFMIVALAASALAYDVTGNVIDELGEPMIKATVRVLNAKDSTAVKGSLTNDDGSFSVTGIKSGKYILEASYVGYNPYHAPIVVKDANLKVGTIKMQENAIALKETTVVGIKTPIKVMEDTVEFNADSYKTQPNAVVEDLLKRLPGVEVDTDGKITHNGKQITKILVDGEEFFSDDPKVASKNLPVNMVDKLQVVDRKSDLARMTGVDDGEDETVINLTIKKGMKNGWFGNVEAGYGTDDRYNANFTVNHFRGSNQLTILGGINNVNDMRFSDGGMGRFSNFGGQGGITTSRALGVNFSVGSSERFRVGGDILYSNTRADARTHLNKQYLFEDSSSFSEQTRNSLGRRNNIRADFRIQWKPDSSNTLEFRPNISANFNDSEATNLSQTNAGFRGSNEIGGLVNKSDTRDASHGNSFEFGGRLIFNHNFRNHPGRSFSVSAQLRYSNRRERANTYGEILYNLLQRDSIYDQFNDNHTWSNNFNTRLTWTEPLGDVKKGNYLEFSYQFSYRWNNADRLSYERPIDLAYDELFDLHPQPGDVLNTDLSNRFRNDYMNQDIRVGYRHVTKSANLNVGLSLVPQMSKSINLIDDNKTIPERWVWNVAPYLRYRLKMSKTRSMNMFYNGRSSQPSMQQLQPVADVSDPLNIIQGNPNLSPSFTHNLNASFSDFNMEAQRSMMFNLRASMTQNSIVSRTEFNRETGGQYTTYENVNGVWSVNAFSMVSFPLRNKSWTINNHFGGNYMQNVGYTNGLRNRSGNLGVFESFGIAFRPDNLELELRPTYRLQYSTNSIKTNANRTIHSYGGMFNGTYYAPFGLVLSTTLNYTSNHGYGSGYNTNEWMWNASISYQFLRDRSLTVTLSGNDLLQQRKNIQRSVTANYIQDASYNTLTRYFMATVSYRFQSFAKGKGVDMPGGFDGPMGPMGPGAPRGGFAPGGGPRGGGGFGGGRRPF